MGRDRGRDRDRWRDWDRDRDRVRDRSRDRGRDSRLRLSPAPLRKPTTEPGPHHPSGGGMGPPPSRHLWVGNLAPTVSEKMFFEEFQRFGDVESLNHLPGRSYAFVNFSMVQDAVKALRVLQGIHIEGCPIKIEFSKGDMEPSEILWIGFPASLNVDETSLRMAFSPFGQIIRIATFPGRSYAFVHYRDVASASRARETLNGKLFNNPRVHISFARSEAALSEAVGSGPARRSPPRRHGRDPDFEGHRGDFHIRPMSPRLGTTFDRQGIEPMRRGSENIPFDEGHSIPSFERRQGLVYDEPYPLPSERRRVPYSDDPYLLPLPPHERRRGPYPDDSHTLPPLVNHRQGPEHDDYYPLHKRMRVSPDTIGDLESELPEYPFDELSRGRSTRFSQLNEGFGGVRAGPGLGGVLDVNMGKSSSLNVNRSVMKEVWKWEGVIAKGGAAVCRAQCFPVGKTIDFTLPEILNCSARTNLEMLSRHYYQAAASWVVFFAPGSDSDIASYNDFMHYLTEKQRVAVAKLEEKVSLFLVPPSDFTEKVLKVAGKLSISGLILKFNQQMVTDRDPGPTFDQSVSKPGRRIEESSVYKAHDSPDFRSHVGPSSGNFTSGNFSSGFTPPHLPSSSIQQQIHGPGALGYTPPLPLNSIQQQVQEVGTSGYTPQPPPPPQQQHLEQGPMGFTRLPPPNLLQQQNLEQGPMGFAHLPPPNPLRQQNLEQGPMGFACTLPPNPLQQQNLEQGLMGFPRLLPPNPIQQQNLEPNTSGFPNQPPSNPTWQQEPNTSGFPNQPPSNPTWQQEPNTSGFPHQPPSNPTWQQIQQPLNVGCYDPFQNSNLSENFQYRPELTSNYISAPPPLPPGPPPPRVVVPPSIPQPVSMPFQFGTNYISYQQNSLEQIQNLNSNLNPNTNVNPIMNGIPLPPYASQASPVPPGIWGPPVSQAITSVPPAVQQQQKVSSAAGGVEGENAAEPDQHKRLQATMQLAAVLLQQMQQQASTGTDRR